MRRKPIADNLRFFSLPHAMQFVRHLNIRQFGGFKGQIEGRMLKQLNPSLYFGFNIDEASYDGVSKWMLSHDKVHDRVHLYKLDRGALFEMSDHVFFVSLCSIESISTKGHITMTKSEDIFDFLTT